MSQNSSLLLSSINPALPFGLDCFILNSGCFIIYTITILFLLFPLCIFILCHGLRRWWRRRSSSTATVSHSDILTYHMATMELMNVFGNIIYCCSISQNMVPVLLVWFYLSVFTWYGETFFHLLTCIEHYLAVVLPITYLSLRKERGIRVRNIGIGCIWLLCFVGTIMIFLKNSYLIVELCLLISCLSAVFVCCLSVLLVLIRPGPGKQVNDKVGIDQSKQKAFYTILAILGVLLLKFSLNLVWTMISILNGGNTSCVELICALWMNLPGSLLLPVLFLQRTGTFVCCKKKFNEN